MARLRAACDLRMERYYRGAVVQLSSGRTFALPESAVRHIEAVRDPASLAGVEIDRTVVARLIELKILEWSER